VGTYCMLTDESSTWYSLTGRSVVSANRGCAASERLALFQGNLGQHRMHSIPYKTISFVKRR